MANNKSDYTKPFTDLYNLLPEVYQSETNETLFNNLFNRFLTKSETKKVVGYVGDGNKEAIIKRQIQEPDVHRQGYQLQPLIYNKIGSEEWISSWYDILNKCERLGIDKELMQQWLDLLKFNWIPPIDLDKFLNYRDYYWVDTDNPSSKPQYLTIRSRCSTAIANANFQQQLVDEYGETINTNGSRHTNDVQYQYNILSLDDVSDTISISGDVTGNINIGQWVSIEGTLTNNGFYEVIGFTYISGIDTTIINVESGALTSLETNIGTVIFNKYDKFVIDGDYISLFDPGFVFFYKNASNDQLNDTFFTVIDSQYDEEFNQTIIQIDLVFDNPIVDGVISQYEMLVNALSTRDCQCSGALGWDMLPWDDNPETPSIWWNGTDDQSSLISTISHSTAPTLPGTDGEIWWDTNNDELLQYVEFTDEWKVIWNRFSLVVNRTKGINYWDYTPGCGINSVVSSSEQWITENKWLHKTDVDNFNNVNQAALPIIEFDWDLELNEWTEIVYKWKYRVDEYSEFESTDIKPELIELTPLTDWVIDGDYIVFDERYGDLTDWFVNGQQFMSTVDPEIYTVDHSLYKEANNNQPYQTHVKITEDVTLTPLNAGSPVSIGSHALRPLHTAAGDPWKSHGIHWLFDGSEDPKPVNHQPKNDFALINTSVAPTGSPIVDTSGSPTTYTSDDYDYRYTYYAFEAYIKKQKSTILTGTPPTATIDAVNRLEFPLNVLPGTSRSLSERSLMGFNDVRVYVNGIRQYGTYDELSNDGTYVSGIEFLPGYQPERFDTVRIEVGESSPKDFGWFNLPVRTIEDNAQFNLALIANDPSGYNNVTNFSDTNVSLINFKKQEQVKSKTNQYPLFDVYTTDSINANKVSTIFSYKTSSDSDVNSNINLRLTTDTYEEDYVFNQTLLDENGGMYAFRDYYNQNKAIWVNPDTNQVWFWDGLTWSSKRQMGEYYMSAIVSRTTPTAPFDDIDGLYWFDNYNIKLYVLSITPITLEKVWNEVTDVIIQTGDQSLQTIWRKGLNDELYNPEKRDWDKRSLEEYNTEKQLYVEQEAQEIELTENVTPAESIVLAETQWYEKESNHLSTNGQWVGDWEIPDPLYYNVSHENREEVTYRELITHFQTIIDAQPKYPGFNGPKENMFHLIPFNEINFGLGGTIREYNHGFDTFLSSLFVNDTTPRGVIDFAQQQYESLLTRMVDDFYRHYLTYMTDTTFDSLNNQVSFISSTILNNHELNDYLNAIYKDSSAYNSQEDLGIKNWIATLPYLNLLRAVNPHLNVDETTEIVEVVHHDGHIKNYTLPADLREGITRTLLIEPDPRTVYPGPNDPPRDVFGRLSASLPPNNVTEFELDFTEQIYQRLGVYWYYNNGTTKTLYRFDPVAVGDEEPSVNDSAEGSVWLDTTVGVEVLRVLKTNIITGQPEWVEAEGVTPGEYPIRLHNGTDNNDVTTSTVSAWTPVSIDLIIGGTVVDVEHKLYENVTEPYQLDYDFSQLSTLNDTQYISLEQDMFDDYLTEYEISTPFANDDYSSTDPFTWNYKFSSPGTSYNIVGVDINNNSFDVEGNVTTNFPLSFTFYIKNSGVNDGTWVTHSTTPSTYSSGITTIYVENRDIEQSLLGIIYAGVTNLLPSDINDGSESGGYWKDWYEKLYGTPYPHLEPWVLQGYQQKPTWWDAEYLNDDPLKWGERHWKYKHGFEIVDVDIVKDEFHVDGNFMELFDVGETITIDQSDNSVHGGDWILDYYFYNDINIAVVNTGNIGTASFEITGDHQSKFESGFVFDVLDTAGNKTQTITVRDVAWNGSPNNRTVIFVEEAISSGTGFDHLSGVYYDSNTNRTRLTVDTTASPNNDITVDIAEGRIVKAYGMWENISIGVIPPGKEYPNGVISVTGNPYEDNTPDIPTYIYFSVNIGNVDIVNGDYTHKPDDVFPPYWDYITYFQTSLPPVFDRPIRSVLTSFSEVVLPGADYTYGDKGRVEWEWSHSMYWLYSQLTMAFIMDPVRFTYQSFGVDFDTIAGLMIDKRTNKVLSHWDTLFHGEMYNNEILEFEGMNQWYINYARYHNLDISTSDFRSNWTDWTNPLAYQFATFVDTQSLTVDHRNVAISEFDYNITSKISRHVDDFTLTSFNITTINIPPVYARYQNDLDWVFEINVQNKFNNVNYYDIKNYQFYADPLTDLCTLYTWKVANVDVYDNKVYIVGDQTDLFIQNRTFDVSSSTGNDGSYVVMSSSYDVLLNQTIIQIEYNTPLSSFTADGLIHLNYRELPWATGDQVIVTTTEALPYPLLDEDFNGMFSYFVIVENDTQFRLSRTKNDAEASLYVDITAEGLGDQYVGQISTTFTDNSTGITWKHYVVDESNVLSFTTPQEVKGIQQIINIVDGYERIIGTQGWVINEDGVAVDTNTGRLQGYQLEIERFIAYNNNLRSEKRTINNQYECTVDVSSDTFTFNESGKTAKFITGDAVVVYVSENVYPTPLANGVRYYIIRDSLSDFRLATTKANAESGNEIDITSIAGVEKIYIAGADTLRLLRPTYEINPFRNNIWFEPEYGIVSNFNDTIYTDVYNSQSALDQYGRILDTKYVHALRRDKSTHVYVNDGIQNDIELTSVFNDPLNYLHLSSLHLFVDTYEHIMLINDSTTEGYLLYDPFIGLNVTKYELLFNRQLEFTQRPNVGGQYLNTYYNQGAELYRNIEASIEDLRYMYDTYRTIETNTLTKNARKTMGYTGPELYLDQLNINRKSQFVYWRGQIQHKGSVNSLKAFVNSRRFIDAKIDDFWAFKIADFGSVHEHEYVHMKLTSADARSNEMRMYFISSTEQPPTDYPSFQQISLTDNNRWVNQPLQLDTLRNNGGQMYFEMKPYHEINIDVQNDLLGVSNDIIRHNLKSDFIKITTDWRKDHIYTATDVSNGTNVSVTIDTYLPGTENIEVFVNGVKQELGVGFIEENLPISNTIIITNALSGSPSTDLIDVVYKNATLVQDVHYSVINSNIIRLDSSLLSALSNMSDTTLWGYEFDKDSQNPAKLIDNESNVVISPISSWDPARNRHFYSGDVTIKLRNESDPAMYSNTLQQRELNNVDGTTIIYPDPWNAREVGTTWLDTSRMDYVPYYDENAIVDIEDRFRQWGKLADWGEFTIKTWIESDVHPEDWNALAEQEEGDIAIEENQRKSGRIYPTLYEMENSEWIVLKDKVDDFDMSIEGVSGYITLNNIKPRIVDIIELDDINNTVTIEGDFSRRIYVDTNINNMAYIELSGTTSGVFTVKSVTLDGDNTKIEVNEDILPVGSPIGSPYVGSPLVEQCTFFEPISCYVNGVIIHETKNVHPSGIITTTDLGDFKEADRIRCAQLIPSDDDFIAAEVESGMLQQEYRYTEITTYDSLGVEQINYYFWVEDKSTKNVDNQITPKEAVSVMTKVPETYMFFNNPQREEMVTFSSQPTLLPVRYKQCIVRGLRGIINSDDRYEIRWVRDFTTRDSIDTSLKTKNLHEEWELLRREQLTHIPVALWNKLTEAMVGYKLDDSNQLTTTIVPSVEYKLYDTENYTSTQYGLNGNQIIASAEYMKSTIMQHLNDYTLDFSPVDINIFFDTYSFDTNENIVEAMNAIYNTFTYEHVNNMFFDVLLDGLSLQHKMENVFKTSMVALHGVRPFEVNGLFDD